MKNHSWEVSANKALQDWKIAELYLQNSADPALVDYAVHQSEAARKKYLYLLEMARKDSVGLTN